MEVQTIYEEYKEKILHMAKNFSKRCKGKVELNELVSVGYLSFAHAVETHDPLKGDLAHYITFMVHKGWQDYCRKDMRQKGREQQDSQLVDPVPMEDEYEDKQVDTFSEDASLLIRVALNPPVDVQVNAGVIKRKYSRGVILQMAIVEYLMDLGWAMNRIEEGFSEVRELLNG